MSDARSRGRELPPFRRERDRRIVTARHGWGHSRFATWRAYAVLIAFYTTVALSCLNAVPD